MRPFTSLLRVGPRRMDKSARRHWVGFDLGGTKMMAAALSDELRILGRRRRKTKGADGAKAGMERNLEAIRDCLDDRKVPADELAGIGVRCPGNIDLDRG